MAERRALLIGVPECDDRSFAPINDVVRSDLSRIKDALTRSAYQIETIGADGMEPSRNRVRAALANACATAPRGSTLFMYFSGHGVTIDGVDYLVPSDAYREPGASAPAPDSLVPALPDLRHCNAKLVVFFIDACRDTPASVPPAGGGVLHFPAGGGHLVMVAGCQPGQRCGYGEDGSFFTRALARALDRRNPAKTLDEVLVEVKREMRRTIGHGDNPGQLPNPYPTAALAAAADLQICDGDELVSAWRRVATGDNKLWDITDKPDDSLAAKLARLVERCARRHTEISEYLKERTGLRDPWFDPNYPARVLSFAAQLLGPETELAPDEAAVLIAAPFLREWVLAEGLKVAADLRPADFRRSYETGDRTDLELTHEMYPQVTRRAEGLATRGATDAADGLTLWLVHRWLSGLPSLWQLPANGLPYSLGADLLVTPRLSTGQRRTLVETLVRTIAADPDNLPLGERLASTQLSDSWRGYLGVMWLASVLAADPRQLSPVIADHLGTGLELSLAAVRSAADVLKLDGRKGVLHLDLICEHPAQHAAFGDVAASAQRVLDRLPQLGGLGTVGDRLPARITADGVRPDQPGSDGVSSYEVPLTRFHLSEDKVRELLMGRQLYDDPSLAVRELYQNALDACRYRSTRLEGLRREGKSPSPWEGDIVFRQGTENGREYIECEDNGVGMGREILEHVFANAGERFVHRSEYRAEHARWQSLDPPLRMVSNSQFGVGVFSYFMIADEILLHTRPVDIRGNASSEGFTVWIASSGSLIQVTPSEEMLGGGTRIRLYLTGDREEERISVLQTLRKLLWIAEFRVRASENGSAPEEWKPRELRYQDESAQSLKADDDLWWVSGDGCLAADGIKTNEEIYGLVANLRDTRRPQFTVDRKKLRTWDKEWVNKTIDASLPELMKWPGLTLSWLWSVTNSNPQIAQRIHDHLTLTEIPVQVGGSWGQNLSVAVSKVGCVPNDTELFDPKNWNRYFARWFYTWRTGIWPNLASPQRFGHRLPSAKRVDGFPIPDAVDGALLGKLDWFTDDSQTWVDRILLNVADFPDQSVEHMLRRLRRFVGLGLDLGQMRRCPPLAKTFKKEEESSIVRALAAWTPPGQNPPPVPAGWLVKCSAQLDLPLAEVLRRAGELAPEGWTPPDLDLTTLGGQTFTAAEGRLVSVDLDGHPPWIEEPIQPDHIAYAAGELGRDVVEILEMCDRLAPLGVRVEGRDLYPDSFERVEIEALRQLENIGDRLTPIHIVTVAAWAGKGIRETREALLPFERRGLLELSELPTELDFVPDASTLGIINWLMASLRVKARRRALTRRPPYLVVAAAGSGRYVSQSFAASIDQLKPFFAPEEPVTNQQLVMLAKMINGTVGDARRCVANAYPEAELPVEVPGTEKLIPWFITDYLMSETWESGGVEWARAPGKIISGAVTHGVSVGAFLAHIGKYRALGAPIPVVSDADMERLSAWRPDPYDEDMVKLYEVGDEFVVHLTEISSLRFVQVAARLGLTLAETRQRFARMVPLGLTLEYPEVELPDEIVRWQDLVLLTTYMDGQEPRLEGEVDPEHVRRVAAETGSSTAWLWERVRLFAPLLSLTVPEGVADAGTA